MQERDIAGVAIVEAGDPERPDDCQRQQAGREPREGPIEPRDPPHSAALPNASSQARRSRRSASASSDCISARVCCGSIWTKRRREGSRPRTAPPASIRQRPDVVHVVPLGQHVHGQPQLGGAIQRLTRHVFRAPGDVLEQTAMGRLQAEQVIAAIVRGSEHDTVTGPIERLRGFDQERRGQRGTIGIQHDSAAVTVLQQLRNGAKQAVAEIRVPGLDHPDLGRQVRSKEWLRLRRSERHIGGDGGVTGGRENIVGDVAQERRVASCRFFECERRHQAGLGAAGNRCLGHHGDPAGRDRRILAMRNCSPHGLSHSSRQARQCSFVRCDKRKRFTPCGESFVYGKVTRSRSVHGAVNAVIADRQWFVPCGGRHAGTEVTQPSHLAGEKKTATGGRRFRGSEPISSWASAKMHVPVV